MRNNLPIRLRLRNWLLLRLAGRDPIVLNSRILGELRLDPCRNGLVVGNLFQPATFPKPRPNRLARWLAKVFNVGVQS